MEKNGEFHPEKETSAAKKIQKVVYTPIEKSAGINIGSTDLKGNNRGGDAFPKKDK